MPQQITPAGYARRGTCSCSISQDYRGIILPLCWQGSHECGEEHVQWFDNNQARQGRKTMKMKPLSVCLLLLLLLFNSWAQAAVELSKNAPETYTVKKGDTLWGISGIYLKEPWLWPELWDANPQIDNPHLIYPGDELYLVWLDGEPRLRLRRGREVKLSPSMRVSPLNRAIPAIPLDQIGPWLRHNRVMDEQEINSSAYIVAVEGRALLAGPGDNIFGRGPFPDGERVYTIYRPGQIYIDPVTKEFLGHEVIDIGSAKLLSSNRDAVTELQVTRIEEEVRIGDRLFPVEERILDASYHPKAPEQDIVNGVMIAVAGGLTQIGDMSIVVINKGKREGLQIGNVVAVYQAGEHMFDKESQSSIVLPDTRAGLAMIFESYQKVSFAIVLKTALPLSIFDVIKQP